jgi:hypothetical protein
MAKSLTIAEQNQLLREAIQNGNLGFLVVVTCEETQELVLRYLMINDDLFKSGAGLFFEVPQRDGISSHREFINVPFSSIIMPGKPGKQRSIFIKDNNTGVNIIAKYVGFHDEKTDCKTEEVTFYFEVLIRGNEEDKRIVQLKDIQLKFPSRAECLEQEEMFARKKQVGCLRFPMTLPRGPENPVPYPGFNLLDIQVLFKLCKKHRFTIGNNYPFNNLVIRFSACGPQTKFYDDVPKLTESEQEDFKNFEGQYSKVLMGLPMVSDIQRFSDVTAQEVFLAQFELVKQFNVSSQCALTLPAEYFTLPEPKVILRKGDDDFVQHSSLKLLK